MEYEFSVQSAPIEEVLFLRDEMANLSWAVERRVESLAGRPLNRYEEDRAKRQRTATPPSSPSVAATAMMAYQLSTEVPDHWIPLVPLPDGSGAVRLHRAQMATARFPDPRGWILGRVPLALREEEVPRSGARVTRAYQCARWIDGATHLWVGRRKQPGRGEGSSGLQFDRVRPIQAPR